MGDGTTTDRYTRPVDVVGGLSWEVAEIGLGWDHTCALTNGGSIRGWLGSMAARQLGDSAWALPVTPVDVVEGWSSVSQP